MTLRILPTAARVANEAASVVAERLRRDPGMVLGLPTGRTSRGVYRELARLHAVGQLDFSKAHVVNLDEFIGLSAADRRSFRAFMETHLFRHVNLRPGHVHFLNGRAGDVDAECLRFERRLADLGGIDLQLLGIGENGHIGFNEPADALQARTHRARLAPDTRRANAWLFGGRVAAVPHEALSMGMATILEARSIVLIATGRSKARAVSSMFTGRLTTSQPASLLQLHAGVQVIVDRAAAARVTGAIAPRTES